METWKEINGFSGKLLVSDQGRIKSELRNGTILKSQVDSKGYHRVRVTVDREKRTFKIHREVAKAFLPNPGNLPQVNHIDGNKDNNAASNLEWVTNRDNALHAISSGLWENVRRGSMAENERRKRPVIAKNGSKSIRFESVSAAERYFDSRHIVDVLKGRRAHCKGWQFCYGNEVIA